MKLAQKATPESQPEVFGHPPGLFVLFFAEMWERFSYYGMRALLVLYIIKGFLNRSDADAYAIYGAYAGLVYATPFIGGMLADRLLGARRAVILGGLLMASGHLMMTIEAEIPFFAALALLIVGNGFFKPNISAIVGTLYPDASPKRDGGFTIFYIGINLGAAMSPLLCGYVGENYGWHYGFGLATIGMLVGLAIFVVPAGVARFIILFTALGSAALMIGLNINESIYSIGSNAFVATGLVIAAGVSFYANSLGGLPEWAGQPNDKELLTKPWLGPVSREWVVYIGAFGIVPVIVGLLVVDAAVGALFTVPVLGIDVTIIGMLMLILAAIALGMMAQEGLKSTIIERHRMVVIVVMMFFSMLFWACFEQAGSSINLFTDRNVDRVFETASVTPDMVGKTIEVEVTAELNGRTMGDKTITLSDIDAWREAKTPTVQWPVSDDDVGMGIEGSEVATSQFQAVNPVFIMIFGLVFSGLWTFLGKRNIEPSTPVKFGLGILQLGLGFAALWLGAQSADGFGVVSMSWVLLGYLLMTTGELCLSPVGLSMVTRLSPKSIVSMVMGAWFLATALSNYLAAAIATLTGVGHGGGEEGTLPPPTETVHIYGDVFGTIAIVTIACSVVVFVLSPLLTKWMHTDELGKDAAAASGH